MNNDNRYLWKHKDLLDVSQLSREDTVHLLDLAASFQEINRRPVKKVPTLKGKTVVLFFSENSTRTKTSFDMAGKRLSADTYSLAKSGSSLNKGESLKDTIARTVPYFENEIAPKMREGKRVIIAAHGNSLRALVMHFEKLTPDEIMKVNLPTGVPLVYEFDDNFNVISKQYLGDPEVIAAKINKVAAQGKKH